MDTPQNNLQFYFTDFTSIYSFIFIHFFWSCYEYGHLIKPDYTHAIDDYKSKLIAPKWLYPILWSLAYICICLSIFFVQYDWNHMEEYVFQTIWIVFIVHTFLSKFWSFIFFYTQSFSLSFFFSIVLVILSLVYFSFCFIIHGSIFPYVTSFLSLPMVMLEVYLALVSFIIMYNGTEVSNKDIKIALNEIARRDEELPNVIKTAINASLMSAVMQAPRGESASNSPNANAVVSPSVPGSAVPAPSMPISRKTPVFFDNIPKKK